MEEEKYQLIQLLIQGKIQGRRKWSRRRLSWSHNLREWFWSIFLFIASISKIWVGVMAAHLLRDTAIVEE